MQSGLPFSGVEGFGVFFGLVPFVFRNWQVLMMAILEARLGRGA